MGRSLKEALLDQYALLQERGLAPSEMPVEDEGPLVVVEAAPRGRSTRSRRESLDRYLDGEEMLDVNGQFDRDRRRVPRRDHRGALDAEGRGERRRPIRGARGARRPSEMEAELTGPAPAPISGDRRPMGPRPPFTGPRPPRPGMGAPRMGGVGRPPIGRTQMLQQRAEQRRREEQDIAEMRRLLAELGGQEMDDAAMDRFSKALAEETGALPPPRIVVEAIKGSQTADPRKIADAVRAYYRRPRPRPQQAGAPQPPPPVPAGA